MCQFKILSKDSEYTTISELGILGGYTAVEAGSKMVEYNSHLGYSEIRASVDNPFVFFADVNDQNQFTLNESKSLVFGYAIFCHSGYVDEEDNYVYAIQDETGHGKIYEYSEDILITENSQSVVQTKTVYTDSTHGYKIMAKLYFQKL